MITVVYDFARGKITPYTFVDGVISRYGGGGTHKDFFGARTRSPYLDGTYMEFETNVALAPLTTFRIGGPAAFFVRASTVQDIQEAVRYAVARDLTIFVLGGGSNVLINDNGFRGLVIKIELKGIEFDERDDKSVLVTSCAGERWDKLVEEAVNRSVYGLENLSDIPGTVGAAPIQNIGAYGTDVSETILWVEALDTKIGNVRRFSNKECMFAYRSSFFKGEQGKRFIVTRVCFQLTARRKLNMSYKDVARYFENRPGEPTLAEMRNAIITIRKGKFPDLNEVGTAGSYFKNLIISKERAEVLQNRYPDLPVYSADGERVKISIAWILDRVLDLKGVRQGAVGTAPDQALALVNYGGGSASDIIAFATHIKKEVKEKIGIDIFSEVIFVAEK